jgi:initiation factor 1A
MVKNVKGGSRHKKQARKHAVDENETHRTRLKNPKELCEVYAVVKQMYGQGNCEVICKDNEKSDFISRLGVIRRRFKGRNKHHNRIMIGTILLVGLRDWETSTKGKREKCDILEVYNSKDISALKKDKNFDDELFKLIETQNNGEPDEGNWEFDYKESGITFDSRGNGVEEDDSSGSGEEFNIDDI